MKPAGASSRFAMNLTGLDIDVTFAIEDNLDE